MAARLDFLPLGAQRVVPTALPRAVLHDESWASKARYDKQEPRPETRPRPFWTGGIRHPAAPATDKSTEANGRHNSSHGTTVCTQGFGWRGVDSHLKGAGDRGYLVHPVHPEERRHVQAAEVIAGPLEPSEHEVALAVIRGANGGWSPAAVRAGGERAALQIALLQNIASKTCCSVRAAGGVFHEVGVGFCTYKCTICVLFIPRQAAPGGGLYGLGCLGRDKISPSHATQLGHLRGRHLSHGTSDNGSGPPILTTAAPPAAPAVTAAAAVVKQQSSAAGPVYLEKTINLPHL